MTSGMPIPNIAAPSLSPSIRRSLTPHQLPFAPSLPLSQLRSFSTLDVLCFTASIILSMSRLIYKPSECHFRPPITTWAHTTRGSNARHHRAAVRQWPNYMNCASAAPVHVIVRRPLRNAIKPFGGYLSSTQPLCMSAL